MVSGRALLDKTFKLHREQVTRLVERQGIKGVRDLYQDARQDLADRLRRTGPRSDRVGPTTLRAMLDQVDDVLSATGTKFRSHLETTGKDLQVLGGRQAIDEYKRLASHFTGTEPVLDLDRASVFRGMVADVTPSLLRRYERSVQVWTLSSIASMEQRLSVSALTAKSMDEAVDELVADQGLAEGERYRAERVFRTEMSHAHQATKHQALVRMSEEREEDGDPPLMKKLLEQVDDDRVGDDSLLIHGQAVKVDEPFSFMRRTRGAYARVEFMHPPNRPNDRATVIPWDLSWDEDDLERPLTREELESAPPTRWRKVVGVEIPPGHRPGKPYEA